MAVGVGLSLGLVADEDVDVRKDLVDLGLEELGDEGSREVHGEGLRNGKRVSLVSCSSRRVVAHLLVVSGVLGKNLGRLETVGKEEPAEVVELGLLNDLLDLGSLQVLGAERLGGSKGGAEGPVEAKDQWRILPAKAETHLSWPVMITAHAPVGFSSTTW